MATDETVACTEVICVSGDLSCLDTVTAILCDDSGTAVTELPCDEGRYCWEGACRNQLCIPGTTRCAGDTLLECAADRRTETSTDCTGIDSYCDPALRACAAWECTPEVSTCDGDDVVTCNARGTGTTVTDPCGDLGCEGGSCIDPPVICEPNTGRCALDVAILCNGDGTEESSTDCGEVEETCFAGECHTPQCEPNTVTCVGNVLERCDSMGLSVSAVPCGEDECAEDECVPRVCQPGLGACDGETGVGTTCALDGLSFETTTCDDPEDCVAGICVSEVCDWDTPLCISDTLVDCEGEEPYVLSCTSLGQNCGDLGRSRACVAQTCSPNTAQCSDDGSNLTYCDGTGRERNQYDCPDNHVCSEAACRVSGCTDYWPDVDGDDYGDQEAEPTCTIAPPSSSHAWAQNDLDCDDGDPLVHEAEDCD